jgi:exopolysaccharide biosynthesis predicted pyruvyltransferase EpsI
MFQLKNLFQVEFTEYKAVLELFENKNVIKNRDLTHQMSPVSESHRFSETLQN